MEQVVSRLFDHLREQTGLADLPFNPGLDGASIDRLSKPTGLALPHEYRALLRAFNGQPPGAALTFPPERLTFLSLEDAVEMWQRLGELESVDEPVDELADDGRVRSVVFHRGRFPIADYEVAAATLFIDFIPGPKGRAGQLVFNPAESTFRVVAPSVDRLIGDYVSVLDGGRARVAQRVPEHGGTFDWLTAEGKLLDFVEYTRLVRR